jgi:hypothetical protein
MARPTKFNPQRARSALLLVKGGEPRQWVARGAGIGRRTLQEWLARGRAGEEPFAAWSKEMDEATRAARRRQVQETYEREDARAKERWQRFRATREDWWLAQLGPAQFWRRRVAWLAANGKTRALGRTIRRLRERGFRTDHTP